MPKCNYWSPKRELTRSQDFYIFWSMQWNHNFAAFNFTLPKTESIKFTIELQRETTRGGRRRNLLLQIAAMGLPSPVLIPQIRPAMLVASQLVGHVWTLRLIVQWIRSVIKNPFAWKHITLLRPHFPTTWLRFPAIPRDFPATVIFRSIALTESIQNF